MELGMDFLVGVLAGLIVAGIVATIVVASRKAATAKAATPALSAAASGTEVRRAEGSASKTSRPGSAPTAVSARSSGHTLVVESVESRDNQLHDNVQEVRELLLRLADVVGKTGDMSGKAAIAFNSVRSVVDGMDIAGRDDLAEAQSLLIKEIDRLLKTNAVLNNELEKANSGIAEQRQQIEELRVQARIDGLTRIPNRAAFDERLREYLALFERSGLAFTLLLLDIDHFKRINDEYGHINGDRILRGVATKIADSIRTNDFAARYGGEEFAVIFPGTGLMEALTVAERMRQDLAKTNFRMDDKSLRMTVSGGLAECSEGMKVDTLLETADRALYQAKNEGRNRMMTEKAAKGT